MSFSTARWAIALVFLANGFTIGSWAPHIPFAKERVGVDVGLFGVLLLGMAVGALISMPLAGALIARTGSRPVVLGAGVLFIVCFALPVLAPGAVTLALALTLFGAANGAMDVAMNAHGVAVEKGLGRPVMSSFHGMFSVGGFLGAAVGGAMPIAAAEWFHVLVVIGVALSMMAIASRGLLPGTVDRGEGGEPHFALPSRATVGVGMLCFFALMMEGAVLDWAALHLTGAHAEWSARAGWGFAVFSAGMAVSRFSGDALRARFGAYAVVMASAVLTGIGITAAALSPVFVIAIAAYGVAGLGIGNIAPILFAGGARLEPSAPGRGIAAVTTLGYSGFLAGPPLIGFVAQGTGLPIALVVMAAFAFVIMAGARAVRVLDRTG
jgi:MFS family permease